MSEPEAIEILPGRFGTVVDAPDFTAVRWLVPRSQQPSPIHSHEAHSQLCIIVAGCVELEIDHSRWRLAAGDMFYLPPFVPHGRTTVLGDTDAVLVDLFSPRRDDYAASITKHRG